MRRLPVFFTALLASFPAFASIDTKVWEAGTSIVTESGDFGTGSNISIFYMPFSVRRYFDPGDLELIVPFISVTSEGQVVVVNGVPNRHGRGGGSSTTTARVTHSGLGDMIFRGRFYAWNEQEWLPAVDVTGQIKFPTASRSNGLGTGKFDEGLGLELTKSILERWLALGEAGYTFIGSPPGESLNNQWRYALGPGYYLIPKKLLGMILYEEWTPLVDGDPSPRDLLFELSYRATDRLRLETSIQTGLSDGAADFGFNIGARFKF